MWDVLFDCVGRCVEDEGDFLYLCGGLFGWGVEVWIVGVCE